MDETSPPTKRVRFRNHDEYIEDERRLFPYFIAPTEIDDFYPENSILDISAATVTENDERTDQEEESLCIDDLANYEDAVQIPESGGSRDFNETLSDIDQTDENYDSDSDSDPRKKLDRRQISTRELLATPITAVASIGVVSALVHAVDGRDAVDEDDLRAAMVLHGKEGGANVGAGQGSGGGGGPATP
jgi:hypothetical protein